MSSFDPVLRVNGLTMLPYEIFLAEQEYESEQIQRSAEEVQAMFVQRIMAANARARQEQIALLLGIHDIPDNVIDAP